MDDRELADLERRVRDSVAGDLRATLSALQATVSAVYVAAAGDTRHKLPEAAQATLRAHLVGVLGELSRRDYATTRQVLIGAARAGLAGGGDDLGVEVERRLPADVRDALKALTAGMRDDLKAARRLARLGSLERYGDAQAILSTAKAALNRADRAAVWVVHRAHNEGRTRAIDRLWSQGAGVRRMWRAERDACPRCLGFAGAIAEPGEPFHPVVDVADASAGSGPLMEPPAHPWCRCVVEPWSGAAEADLTNVDLPVALRREAQRSILRGDAQGSRPARLRAADRLADLAGLLVPKTVVKRARKAVASGNFPK